MKIIKGGKISWAMDVDADADAMDGCGCSGNNGGFLDNLFGGNGNTEILLFLVVFLLLFTTFGRQNTNFIG